MKSLLLAFLVLLPCAGKVFLSQKQAIKQVFGQQEIQSQTHYWSKAQQQKIQHLADAKKVGRLGKEFHDQGGRTAWWDTRQVRSKGQSLLIVIQPNHEVEKILVCSFQEPLEYLPSPKWYAQFAGKKLGPKLQLNKDIHAFTGATLTARATVQAVREALAAHMVAYPPAPGHDDPQ